MDFPNLVIGVYVGYDSETLGKYETGSKAALPIFKDFVEKHFIKRILKNFNTRKYIFNILELRYRP